MFRARQCTTEIGTWCLALLPSLILLSVWFIVSHHGDKIPLLLKSQLTSRSQIFQFRCFRDASLNISAIFGSKRLVLWGLCLCSNMGCNHAKAPGVEDRTIPGTGTNVLDTISWFIEKKKDQDVAWRMIRRCQATDDGWLELLPALLSGIQRELVKSLRCHCQFRCPGNDLNP